MKRFLTGTISILLVIAVSFSIAYFTKVDIPGGSEEKIGVYTRNKPKAEITVAVIHSGSVDIRAYTRDGETEPDPARPYEIGAVTKTFLGAMAAKSVIDGKLALTEKASKYLDLYMVTYTPSLFDLVTHTSAYGDYLPSKVSRFSSLTGKNPYYGISNRDVISAMDSFRLVQQPPYMYSYSETGAAITGMLLEKVYYDSFYNLLNDYVHNRLGLENTYVCTDDSVENGWKWDPEDAYIPALGLTSTAGDMVRYVQYYLSSGDTEYPELALSAKALAGVNMELSVGYFWDITENDVLSQSGETGHYASRILIDRGNDTAVIVLSNYGNDKYGDVNDIALEILKEELSVS